MLSNSVNSEFWESQPAISQDGSVLFFVSNRPTYKGDDDLDKNIWYSVKNTNGEWQKAKPLEDINTVGDDVTPHQGSDGMFYFAKQADGRDDFDIFVCDMDIENGIALPYIPQNLDIYFNNKYQNQPEKFAINTTSNELFPFMDENCSSFYFSSNRSSGYGGYDIYACELPKPVIKLKVKFYEIAEDGTKQATVVYKWNLIENGSTTLYNAEDTAILDYNKSYQINPEIEICECKPVSIIPENHYINTGTISSCGLDSTIVVEFVVKAEAFTSNIDPIIEDENFCTGYWKILTSDNFSEFQSRISSGFFSQSVYVDLSCGHKPSRLKQSADITLKQIENAITDAIAKYKCCIENHGFKIRISTIGWTDPRGLRTPDKYLDETVTVGHHTVTKGSNMSLLGQRGNVSLSKLRAYWTYETINEWMKDINSDYANLFRANKIYGDYDGMGIDVGTTIAECNSDDCEDARRVLIYIDIATENWLKDNKRVIHPKKYKYMLKKGEPLEDLLVDKIKPEPYKYIKKKKCDKINVEYTFQNKEDAELFLYMLKDYNDLDYQIYPDKDSKGNDIFVLQSKTVTTKGDAYKIANESRDNAIKSAKKLKSKWPQLKKSDCQPYAISFGSFKTRQSLDELIYKLDSLKIPNQILMQQIDDSTKIFIVRSVVFESKDEAEKKMRKYVRILNKNVIMHYCRIVRVESRLKDD